MAMTWRRRRKFPPSNTHTMLATTSFTGVRVAAPKTRVASARVAVAPVASLQKVRAQGNPHSTWHTRRAMRRAPATRLAGCGGGVAGCRLWIDPWHSGK